MNGVVQVRVRGHGLYSCCRLCPWEDYGDWRRALLWELVGSSVEAATAHAEGHLVAPVG